jgi:hypothetical protein
MSLFSTLVTFPRPKIMNNLQFKDFLSDTESEYIFCYKEAGWPSWKSQTE